MKAHLLCVVREINFVPNFRGFVLNSFNFNLGVASS